MNIEILYEDDDYLAINKPAGLKIHTDISKEKYSLVDWVKEHYPALLGVGGNFEIGKELRTPRCGIVHRLDKETSGVVWIAKNQGAFDYLQGQIRSRKVLKVYNAFVNGPMKDERGIIDKPIGRSSGEKARWSAGRGSRGTMRDAITQYRVLGFKNPITFVEVIPKTGRTHQIRVHFKAIQHPVVGDALYAPSFPNALGFNRTALHATRFSFTKKEGKRIVVEAPYPEDFKKAIEEMKRV